MHQRNGEGRMNLFGDYETRSSSPYEQPAKKDFNASMLSHLEDQNENEMSAMNEKVKQLKNLGLRMGSEIKNSEINMQNLNQTFDNTRGKLKNNFNKMMIMAENAPIGVKRWAIFFLVVIVIFWLVRLR